MSRSTPVPTDQRVVVIGASGRIGARLVQVLRGRGHDVVAASRASGVDALTGTGLAAAVADAEVVVDVLNAPVFEDSAVLSFFETTTRNLLAAERASRVRHHVTLSVVGAERMPGSGYMRAKVAQEALVRSGDTPFSIVRATQFFEFAGAIAESGRAGDAIRLPPVAMQPVAADDVVAALADVAESAPSNGVLEVAGPERMSMPEFVARFLAATGDARRVTGDAAALYFGAAVNDRTLTPGDAARIGRTRYADWLAHSGRG